MRNEDNPLAAIAIPGWGMAIVLVLIMAAMGLIFWSMMRRLRAERLELQAEAEAAGQTVLTVPTLEDLDRGADGGRHRSADRTAGAVRDTPEPASETVRDTPSKPRQTGD